VEAQTLVAQLTDSGGSSGKNLTSLLCTIIKVLKIEYSKATLGKCYEVQNLFVSVQITKSVDVLC